MPTFAMLFPTIRATDTFSLEAKVSEVLYPLCV